MIDPAQMSQSQSFTTEEMSQIKAVQQKHLDIQLAFGQIHVAEIQLEEQLEQLDVTREQLEDELQLIRDEETALVSKINQKYQFHNQLRYQYHSQYHSQHQHQHQHQYRYHNQHQ